MSDNFQARDANNTILTFRSTYSGGIHIPHHYVQSILSALPAGTNNIGDVDVLTMPADPFGANADAAITTNTTGSISGKLRGLIAIFLDAVGTAADAAVTPGSSGSLSGKIRNMQTMVQAIGAVLPGSLGQKVGAGSFPVVLSSDTSGPVSIDQTVSGTTNGVAVVTGTGAGATIGATGDAAATAGSTGTLSAKLRTVTDALGASADAAVTTNTTGSISGKMRGIVALLAACIDLTNSFINSHLVPHTSGGLSNYHLVSAATTNTNNVKASAGQVYGIQVYNNAAYAVYVKLHNTSGTPTAGSGVVRTFGVPAGGGYIWNSDIGVPLGTGIGISIVKDITDAGTTAVALSDCVVDLQYK